MENYQVPRGTQDILGEDIKKWHYLEELIREFATVYDYEEIRTPIFEHSEVFSRENDSSDMVNKEMYTFLDNGDRSLTLKPEGTAGIIRSYVENKLYASADQPYKCYYVAPAFRYERPQKGRMRIHHQFGIEIIGIKNPIIDVELITLGYSFVKAVGLKDIKVLINTLGDEKSRSDYKAALVEYFKPHIEGFCGDCQRRYRQNPLRILDCKIDKDRPAMKNAPKLSDYLSEDSKAYFKQVLNGLDELEIGYEIDEKLVRGLDYYTDTVFEVVNVNPAMGSQATIFGGGRYDDLVEYFGGPPLSGIGYGMGIERLLVACESEGIEIPLEEGLDVYIMPMKPEYQIKALTLATECRAHGYSTDLDYLGRSLKAQFKTVERKKAKVVLILGEDEIKEKTVTLKRIETQTNITIKEEEMITQLDEWFSEVEDEENA